MRVNLKRMDIRFYKHRFETVLRNGKDTRDKRIGRYDHLIALLHHAHLDVGTEDLIGSFLEKMGGRDDIWYATNGEIATYVKAYDALRFSADGNTVQNPTCTDVYVSCFENDYFIPAGKTVVLKV